MKGRPSPRTSRSRRQKQRLRPSSLFSCGKASSRLHSHFPTPEDAGEPRGRRKEGKKEGRKRKGKYIFSKERMTILIKDTVKSVYWDQLHDTLASQLRQ